MINEEIRAREVRVVDVNGEQLGVLSLDAALKIAVERNLDLVNVAPTAKPPVCRIMDFGKYLYEQSKREKEARKKQTIISVKEMKLRPNIEPHDFSVKAGHVERFLKDGDKVKVTIMFRGREAAHPQLGEQLLNQIAEQLAEISVVERKPKLEGRNMIMILSPKN